MRIGETTLAILAALGLAAGTACASSPDIPEESSEKDPSYQSAESEDNGGDSADGQNQNQRQQQARGQQPSGQTAQAQNGQGAQQPGAQRGGQQPSEPPEATGPVATVDGDSISAEVFNDEIKKVAKTGKFPVPLLHKFKGRLIDRLIDQRLIDDAIEASSVEVSGEEVDDKLEQVRSQFDQAAKQQSGKQGRGQRPQSLEQVASQYGIGQDELRDSIRRSIAIEKLLVDKKDVEMPTDKEIRKFYDNNQKQFSRPEQVRVRHILVRVQPKAGDETWKKAEKKIGKIRKKATKDSTKFAKLARDKSDGPSAKKGGDVGFIGRKQFDKNFTDAAFDLEKSKISKPVKTKYGYHIIKLVDRREAETVPFEEVKDRLAKQLKNKRVHKQLQGYVKELRKDAEIEKHPKNVE
jgi:peptidyl-prolyl cis-trans isomerase C